MITHLVRKSIRELQPYSFAHQALPKEGTTRLDDNENAFGSPLLSEEKFNRYPEPFQTTLKNSISRIKGVPPQNMFIGNGSGEIIDSLFRIFCEPATDACIICPPTDNRYAFIAQVNNTNCLHIPLLPNLELDVESILENNTAAKLLLLSSPNNPTGNSFHKEDIELLLGKFEGIVVIDEAYINYSRQSSCITLLPHFSNLVVVQTFSHAWGLAGLRLSMAFASSGIIELLDKIKLPHHINSASQQIAVEALHNIAWVNEHIRQTVALREQLCNQLKEISCIEHIYASDTNFVLIRVKDADTTHKFLLKKGIATSNESHQTLCENCLRITIGTEKENNLLVENLKAIK
ncbi:MAG: histidinol-phosphate transaminase [Chitinophagales bacterium]